MSTRAVGKWIVDPGLVAPDALTGVPAEFARDDLDRFCQETPSPVGLIRHLSPVAELSLTPPHWTRPPLPPGTPPRVAERRRRVSQAIACQGAPRMRDATGQLSACAPAR